MLSGSTLHGGTPCLPALPGGKQTCAEGAPLALHRFAVSISFRLDCHQRLAVWLQRHEIRVNYKVPEIDRESLIRLERPTPAQRIVTVGKQTRYTTIEKEKVRALDDLRFV